MASRMMVGAAVLVLLACWAQPSSAAIRACEESGYCSVGSSKHWVGEITTGAGRRQTNF